LTSKEKGYNRDMTNRTITHVTDEILHFLGDLYRFEYSKIITIGEEQKEVFFRYRECDGRLVCWVFTKEHNGHPVFGLAMSKEPDIEEKEAVDDLIDAVGSEIGI
jgi:hypothetical protein